MQVKFVCPNRDCDRTYVNSGILKRHIQAFHSNTKRFVCDHCGKSLASRQNLKEHKFIHTGERPYVCTFPGCSESFRQGTHLSAHKKFEHIDAVEGKIPDRYVYPQFFDGKWRENNKPKEISAGKIESNLALPLITKPQMFKLPNIFFGDLKRD